MNEQEIIDLLKDMRAKGWNAQLCDTPIPLYDNPVKAGIPNGVGYIADGDMVMLPKDMIRAGWRWHINFCPGWKGYFTSQSEEKKAELRTKYNFTKY